MAKEKELPPLEQARKLHRKFSRRLRNLSNAARLGDKEAPLKLIRTMTEENIALKELGFYLSDNDDGGKTKILPIKPA